MSCKTTFFFVLCTYNPNLGKKGHDMKQFTRILQHPLLKIFVSPLALILFGTLTGIKAGGSFNWLDFILLSLVVISSQLITHFFNLEYNRDNHMSQGILYACEAVMIVSIITLAVTNHWLIAAVLVLYAIYTHIIYKPYNISGTWYHLVLSVVYNSMFLNIVAHFVQTNSFGTSLLIHYSSLLLFYLGIQFEIFYLQSRMSRRPNLIIYQRYLNLALMGASILLGVYFSIPSTSYYLVQILYVIVTTISVLPLVVTTTNTHQMQNKINYLSAVYLIFTLMYGLSIFF